MTAIGILVLAAGVSLVWSGVTGRELLPEIRAALGNPDPGPNHVKIRADGTFVLPGDKDQSGTIVSKAKATDVALSRKAGK